jgi:DNA-binding IclR family transcriptional regulator
VLELAAHSQSATSRLRALALPHLEEIVEVVDESANLMIRTGDTARFIASVECRQALRVGNREGMVFPAHRVTGGLVLLAELGREQVDALYEPERYDERPDERPDLRRLHRDLDRVRSNGFALNEGRSERGVVAVGRPVRDVDGTAVAGVSVSMPSVRYDPHRLPGIVSALGVAAQAIEGDLRRDAS